MSTNLIFSDTSFMALVPDSPASPTSGQACRSGRVTGVAASALDANTGKVVMDIASRVYDLSTKGVDGSGNSAVSVMDELYFVDGDSFLSKKSATGYFFGYALETVGSGSTTTIRVLHVAAPGTGTTPASGSVGTAQLASSGVTAAKLSATLKTGFINLDITTARIIATNAVQNTTEGGVPDGNTTPILERVNGATDIALRLNWAATVVNEVQFAPVALPPDIDDASALTVHLLIAKSANTDNAAVVAVKIFQGVGDSNAGGNTSALSTASLTEYEVTMAAGDLGAAPSFLNVALVPGTHANDAVYLYAAWIEYTRA